MDVKDLIAETVIASQSFLVGTFTKPGSDVIINHWATVSVSDPVVLRALGAALADLARAFEYDRLCGLATNGIALAAATSLANGKPWLYARKERKTNIDGTAFEGTYAEVDRLLLVDNLSAKGAGLAPVLQHASEDGLRVAGLVVIVDTGWEKPLRVASLITSRELIDRLDARGYFGAGVADHLRAFLEKPEEWRPGSPRVTAFTEMLRRDPRPHVRP